MERLSVAGLRVVVAEDDGLICEAICDRLTDAGCEVVATADNGRSAVQAAIETRPDIVLMDVRLKGDMDGIRASELINEKMRVPVVYLTGDSDQKTLARARAASAYGYVLKPFHIRNLIVTIEVAINRFEMERKLEDSQLTYAAILGSITDGVIAIDVRSCVRFMNVVAEQLTGWSTQEAERETIGKVLNLSCSGAASSVADTIGHVLTSRMTFPLGDEAWVTNRDGIRVQVEGNMSCIVDGLDRIVGASITLRDVTNARRTESELKTVAQRLRAVVDTAADGVLMLDDRGTILMLNPACERLFGYASSEMTGRNIESIMPSPLFNVGSSAGTGERPAVRAPLVAAARATICRRRDRSTFPAEVSVGEVNDPKQPLFVCVVHDVSERRDLEAAVFDAVGQEQHRFATDLHDGLGQELTGLALLLSALANEARAENGTNATDLDRAREVATHALQSAQAIARGLSPIEPKEGGLISALRDLVSGLQASSGTAVAMSVSEISLLGLSPAATNHLYRIAQEALTNALKHSHAKSISVTLDIDPEHVRLQICDDGLGVPAQGPNPTGLGLRTMQYRASIIGARFEIAPFEPAGTCIICDCPQGS